MVLSLSPLLPVVPLFSSAEQRQVSAKPILDDTTYFLSLLMFSRLWCTEGTERQWSLI